MNADFCFAVLAELLVKSAVLILAGGLLLGLFHRASAAGRHAVLAAVFVSLLLLPLTRLLPQRSLLSETFLGLTTVTVRTMPVGDQNQGGESSGQPANPEAAVPASIHSLPWSGLACGAWLAGVAFLLGRRTLFALRLRRVVNSSAEIADEELKANVRAIVAESGVCAPVRESALCKVPMVAGVLRPMVLLPADAAAWDASLLKAAMRHELGHIRRRDCLTRGLADVICAFYWPNPLAWLAARQLRLAQEQACDNLVLNSGAPADEYAGQLVDAVRRLQDGGFDARHVMAMAQPSSLEARVLAIMDLTRDRSPRSRVSAVTAATALAVLLAMCATVQVRGAEDASPPDRPQAPQVIISTKIVETNGASGQPPVSQKEGSTESKSMVRITAVQAGGEVPSMPSSGPGAAQVQISSKFVEITGEPEQLPDFLKKAGTQARNLSDPEFQAAIRTLCSRKGVDLLSAPRVVTRSDTRAVVEVSRDFALPKDEKTGNEFAVSKKVGVSFAATPSLNSDGSISMHLVPEVTEFDGFIDIDDMSSKRVKKNADGSVTVSMGKGSKLMRGYIATGPSERSAEDGASLTIPASAKVKRSADGHRHVPMFNTRTIDTKARLTPGSTVLLVCPGRETVQTVEDSVPLLGGIPLLGKLFRNTTEVWYKRHLYVFVTADIVKAGAQSKAKAQ